MCVNAEFVVRHPDAISSKLRLLRTETWYKAGEARRAASSGDPTCEESQGLLAHGENHSQWCRDDECLVRATGRGEPKESMGGTCSASSNRLVRTRTLGGVGRAAREGRPYPITAPRPLQLATENSIDSSENGLQLSARQLTSTFRQLPLVQCDNQRDISNRVLG